MAIKFITPVNVSPGDTNSWIDIDISAYVPAGATGAIIHVLGSDGGAYYADLRKNGSTDTVLGGKPLTAHDWRTVGLDGSRIFEGYTGDPGVNFYLVGYFEGESVFFTNRIDKSLGTTGSWLDVDISSDTGADTAIAAILEVINQATALNYNYGLRKNGSTDGRVIRLSASNSTGAIIGVDASEIFEGQISNANIDWYLIGYIKSGATMLTNATDLSLGSTGSWLDLSALPSGAAGGFIEVVSSGDYLFGLRKKGSSEDIYYYAARHVWGIVECDANRLIQGKIANTGVDFYLVGYPLSLSVRKPQSWIM
jgi:hypothetical protein